MISTAFAPANISLVFETYAASPPHGRGSLGVGITLDQGALAQVQRASQAAPEGILVQDELWAFPTVAAVVAAMTSEPLHLELTAAFPFGCGFGMSGACALAAAYAIDDLLALQLPRQEIGLIAHRAEVAAATGLGDVGGQFNGGIMIKTRKYSPLSVEVLPVPHQPLHCKIYGPIHTAEVIDSAEKLHFINHAGHLALEEITRCGASLSMERLLDISLVFARESKLLTHPRLIQDIENIKAMGGHATMVMLGEAIVSTIPFPGSESVTITSDGGRILKS